MKHRPQCHASHDALDWTYPACGFEPQRSDSLPAVAPESAIATSGFKSEAFAELASLEAVNFWFQAHNQLLLCALQRHFPKKRGYLEIGCGTGFVLECVAKAYPQAALAVAKY
jgi:hypothetical protein